MVNSQINDRQVFLFLAFISVASFIRIFGINDIYWDDNCWLLSIYFRDGLEGFLDDGWNQMRRSPVGLFYYFYFSIHKLSDNPFLYWNSIAILIQVLSTWMVYLLVRILIPQLMLPAVAGAVAYVALPLDHTLPYISGTNYRLGFLLALFSFWLSLRSITGSRPKAYFFFAALIGLLNTIFFTEIALPFEAARLVMIAWVLPRNLSLASRFRQLVGYAFFIGLLYLPYACYRIALKPYGMYSSVYQHNLSYVFDWHGYYELARMVPFGLWRHVNGLPNLNPGLVYILGIGVALCSFLIFRKCAPSDALHEGTSRRSAAKFLAALSLVIILTQQFLLAYSGRDFRWGPDSTHGIFIQLGTSLMCASLALWLSLKSDRGLFKSSVLVPLVFSIFVFGGVHFNNKNISLFIGESEKKKEFWAAFVGRFPSLPPKATFIFDIQSNSYHEASDLDSGYDIEVMLNLLYAPEGANNAYRYTVLAPEDIRNRRPDFSLSQLGVTNRFGHFDLERGKTIPIAYRNGVIYVGKEINALRPVVPYIAWTNEMSAVESVPLEYKYRLNFLPTK